MSTDHTVLLQAYALARFMAGCPSQPGGTVILWQVPLQGGCKSSAHQLAACIRVGPQMASPGHMRQRQGCRIPTARYKINPD